MEALGPPASAPDKGVGFQPGDRVFGLTRFGAYATAVNLDVRYLRPIPQEWALAEAAAFPVQALTAWYGLIELGALESGGVVLVHSAAGGVGLNALAILGKCGGQVVATVGRAADREFLRGRGPRRAITSRRTPGRGACPAWTERAWGNERYDVK